MVKHISPEDKFGIVIDLFTIRRKFSFTLCSRTKYELFPTPSQVEMTPTEENLRKHCGKISPFSHNVF